MKPIRALLLLLLLLVFQPLNHQFNHPLITTAHASSLLNDSMQAQYNGSLTTTTPTNVSDNHLPNPRCSPPGENEIPDGGLAALIPSLVVGSYSAQQLNPAAVMGVLVNQTAPGNSTNPSNVEDNVHDHGNSSKIKVDGHREAIKDGQYKKEAIQTMAVQKADVSTINGKLAGSTPPPGQSSPITMAAQEADVSTINGKLAGSTPPPGQTSFITMAVQEADMSTINGQLAGSTPPPGQTSPIHTAAGASIARAILAGSTPPPGQPSPIHTAAGASIARVQPPQASTTTTTTISSPSSSLHHGGDHHDHDDRIFTTTNVHEDVETS